MQNFEFIKENSEIKLVVDAILRGMVDMNSRSMFFEYKYISMYIFMTVFIQHMYNTMNKFMGEVVQLNEVRSRYRQEANKEIFDAILDAVDKSGVDITEHLRDHDIVIKQKASELQKKINDVQENYKQTMEMNMSGLLEYILKNERSMADSLMRVVQNTPPNSFKSQDQVGGFVKDGSTFPTSFYERS
jgi:hypothetical protein